jgi:hypothetical protein
LNDEILDRAFESCFVEDEEAPAAFVGQPILAAAAFQAASSPHTASVSALENTTC